MTIRWCTYLIVLSLGLLLFSCGGGSSVENSDNSALEAGHKPGPGDQIKTGSVDVFQGEYEDSIPDTWNWDMIFGQGVFLGSAEIVEEDGVYSMCYSLPADMVADGWGFCDAHVDIVDDPADFPKNGSPGQFQWGWNFGFNYPDTPPGDYCLELTGWEPDEDDFYIAVHATACKGSWVYDAENDEYNWVEESNETGWGGVWDAKSEDFEGHWSGNWKKWGGWYFTGDLSRYPIFDSFHKTYYADNVYGDTSYWNINFNGGDPFGFVPDYTQSNPWQGWCTDPRFLGPGYTVHVDVYSCFDPALPDYAKSDNWDLISFMINERRNPTAGGPFAGVNWSVNSNKQAFQDAVWYFKYGPEDPWYPTGDATWYVTIADGSLAEQFVDFAIANGEGYYPQDGQWYAAVLYPVDPFGYNGQRSGELPPGFQMNIVEVDP